MRLAAFESAPLSTIIPATVYGRGGCRILNSSNTKPLTLSSPSFYNNNNYYKTKHLNFKLYAAAANVSSGSGSDDSNKSIKQQLAVLLEVEGVLVDVHRECHREAFNIAFKNMGLDCANWTEPIYLDLVRKCFGGEQEMLTLYFNKIGWPTSLPTNEKGGFIKRVLQDKQKALEDLVKSKSLPLRPGAEEFIDEAHNEGVPSSKSLPLRPGAEEFIDEAHNEGVPVIVLAAYSRNGENVARPIIEGLGEDRTSKMKIVGEAEVKQSFYGQLVLGKGVASSLDEQLLNEARKAASTEKQKIAKEVASVLKLSVDLDTTSSESMQKIVAALRAGAEYAEVPVPNCVLVAGSLPGVAAAEQIGMPCVVLRSKLTSRAEFPSAKAVLDSFGAPDLTISRLRRIGSA